MEAARLGLQDFQLGNLGGGLLGRAPPPLGLSLPFMPGCEPWAAAAAAIGMSVGQAAPTLSTLSHALPGFLSHPQVTITEFSLKLYRILLRNMYYGKSYKYKFQCIIRHHMQAICQQIRLQDQGAMEWFFRPHHLF